MHKIVIAAGVLAAALGTARAEPTPAWCKGKFSGSLNLQMLNDPRPDVVMETYAQAVCEPTPDVDKVRASIEQGRKAWAKRLGMEEADWADEVAFIHSNGNTPATLSSKDPTKFTAIDQYIAIVEGIELPTGGQVQREAHYVADMFDANLTELGRFGYLTRCMDQSSGPADWALCQGDAEKLDTGKLYAEIRQDAAHDGAYKMMLRYAALSIGAELKKHATEVQRVWAKDPVYKRMFEISAKAREEWANTLAKDSELLGVVRQAEAAFFSSSRSLRASCDTATTGALAKAVGKLPAKTFANMFDQRFDPTKGFAAAAGPVLVANPGINLAALAYTLCKRDGTADFLAGALITSAGVRGPRTLGFARMLAEKLRLDDESQQIKWPDNSRPYDRGYGAPVSTGGVIASVKPSGDTVTVSFEKMVVKRNECVQSHQTTRIYKLHPDGRVEYEQVCDKMGIVAHDEQWADFQVNKKYLPQLVKGTRITVVQPTQDARDAGTEVIATWPNAKADTPSWVLGAPLR